MHNIIQVLNTVTVTASRPGAPLMAGNAASYPSYKEGRIDVDHVSRSALCAATSHEPPGEERSKARLATLGCTPDPVEKGIGCTGPSPEVGKAPARLGGPSKHHIFHGQSYTTEPRLCYIVEDNRNSTKNRRFGTRFG